MKTKPRREGARIYDGWWMLAALCLRIKVAVLIRDLEPDKGFPSRDYVPSALGSLSCFK